MGDLSIHFSRKEFRCHHCGIAKVAPGLVAGLEALRTLAYPGGLVIESAYRCATHNRALPHAAANSQHRYGAAADVALVAELAAVKDLRAFSGIGWQRVGKRRLVRHVDVRHTSGVNPTGGTVLSPTTWEYLADGSRR